MGGYIVMIYSETALKNIIKENIHNKRIIRCASKLYCHGAWDNDYEETEKELTALLLAKQYEKPRPEPPITRNGE